MTSVWEMIWAHAAITFGKRGGFNEPLSPYSRTAKMVMSRADHALWLWNDKYGPLTREQREYAEALIVHSLQKALDAPTIHERYAWFNAELTRCLNHETVAAGFKSRRGGGEELVDLGGLFTGIGA